MEAMMLYLNGRNTTLQISGIQTTSKVKQIDQITKVIIFTMHSYCEIINALIMFGISAYVFKEDPISDLWMAILAVETDEAYFRDDVHGLLN
jgi:DNA-binding NarL/FixJ family response regulator